MNFSAFDSRLEGVRFSKNRGFTLLELMLALTILVLVAGGIYVMISASMQATFETGLTQERVRKEEVLTELLRAGFANIAPNSRLSLQTRQVRGVSLREIFVEEAPDVWSFGLLQGYCGPIGFTLAAGADGLISLGIVRDAFHTSGSPAGTASDWMRLAGGFRYLDWSVFDPTRRQWVGNWSLAALPQLVRLRWQLQGEESVSERIFDIPASRAAPVQKPAQ